MTQAPPPIAPASAPPVPAGALACEFCKQPIVDPFYRAAGRVACARCAEQVLQLRELNKFSASAFFRALFFGLGASIASGFIWALIAKGTERELAVVAIGVAWLVSKAVLGGGFGRRGPAMQTVAIAFTVIGIWIGKGLILSWAFWDQYVAAHPDHATNAFRIIRFIIAPIQLFSAYDLLFYGFAIWRAWRMLHSVNVPIEGPFAPSANPSAPIPGLQFNKVEPIPTMPEQPPSPIVPPPAR